MSRKKKSCAKHPSYQAKSRPTHDCSDCMDVWLTLALIVDDALSTPIDPDPGPSYHDSSPSHHDSYDSGGGGDFGGGGGMD